MVSVPSDPRRLAPWLWALWFAFVLRVSGQMLVAFAGVDWLPPMEAWMSGLMPYPYLLPAQGVLIVVFGTVARDFSRGSGWSLRPAGGGRLLLYFGYAYFAGMIIRYVLTMALRPEQRWLGGAIPIFFHFVLATFIILVASWRLQTQKAVRASSAG